MRRLAFLLGMLFLVSAVPLFADTGIEAPSAVDVRSLSMGGFHNCDFSSPYILMTNPAGIAAAGKKTLLPSVALDFGGPLSSIPDLYTAVKDSDDMMDAIVDELLSMVSESNGAFVDVDVSLPLTFARINKNNGFGVFNRVYARSAIPSLTEAGVDLGAEMLLVWGSALPIIKTRNHLLSVGTSTKLLARAEMSYSGTPSNLDSIDFMELPIEGAAALGMDVGITYRMFNTVSVSAVWHDAYAGLRGGLGTASDLSFSVDGDIPEIFLEKGALGIGLALALPSAKFTKGVVNSWTIYADMRDVLPLVLGDDDVFTESPLLSVSAGMEIVVFNTISLRVGLNGPYLTAGAGIDLTPFHMEFAIYGKERGLEPGTAAQMHGAFSISFHY